MHLNLCDWCTSPYDITLWQEKQTIFAEAFCVHTAAASLDWPLFMQSESQSKQRP